MPKPSLNIGRCREILHDLSNKVSAVELAQRTGKDEIYYRALLAIKTRLREMDELVSAVVPALAQGTDKIPIVPMPPDSPEHSTGE